MSYLLLNSNAKLLLVKFYKTCNGYKVMSLKVRIHVNLVSMEIWVLLYWDDMFLQEPFCVSVMNTGWHMLCNVIGNTVLSCFVADTGQCSECSV